MSEKTKEFQFKCEVCEGEAKTKSLSIGQQFNCPFRCGASYVLWKNPETNKIEAMCVIKPIFIEKGDDRNK